mgnify:CR=1 FL=1|jgi:hypothetical protein
MDEQDKQITEQTAEDQPARGRTAFIERYRGYHPELTDDPADDDLFDFASAGLTERDEVSEKYNKLNGANEKLAAVVSEDPRVAQFIALIAAGENPIYALGKTFGNLIDQLDEASLEELKKGQEEFKARYDNIRANFQNYEATLKGYQEKNGLSDEDAANINNAILDIAEAFNNGDIPEEVIDNVYKGMDHDAAKESEIEAARLAGRNEAIEAIKDKKGAPAPLPDLNKTAPKSPTRKPRQTQDEFVDVLSDSEKIR